MNGIQSLQTSFTGAQIKTLPSIPLVLIPATEVLNYVLPCSKIFVPVGISLIFNNKQGAYTNVASPVWLDFYWGSDGSVPAGTLGGFLPITYPKPSAMQIADASPFFTLEAAKAIFGYMNFLPKGWIDDFAGGIMQDNALCIKANNGALGNFTGGNAANTLRAIVYYTQLDF